MATDNTNPSTLRIDWSQTRILNNRPVSGINLITNKNGSVAIDVTIYSKGNTNTGEMSGTRMARLQIEPIQHPIESKLVGFRLKQVSQNPDGIEVVLSSTDLTLKK